MYIIFLLLFNYITNVIFYYFFVERIIICFIDILISMFIDFQTIGTCKNWIPIHAKIPCMVTCRAGSLCWGMVLAFFLAWKPRKGGCHKLGNRHGKRKDFSLDFVITINKLKFIQEATERQFENIDDREGMEKARIGYAFWKTSLKILRKAIKMLSSSKANQQVVNQLF